MYMTCMCATMVRVCNMNVHMYVYMYVHVVPHEPSLLIIILILHMYSTSIRLQIPPTQATTWSMPVQSLVRPETYNPVTENLRNGDKSNRFD